MRSIRNKKAIIIATILMIILLITVVFFVTRTKTSEKSVKILNYGYSLCTQNVPSSSCGPYEVNVESKGGAKSTYKVAGFSNKQSKKYDEISSKIEASKQQNIYIVLNVNNEGEIISIN